MAKNAKEVMKRLPVSRRKNIEARAALLIAEEMTLQEMRKARELTQEKLAKSSWRQSKAGVRHREAHRYAPLDIATDGRKMGGHLTIVVEFPDREPVTLRGIATAELKRTPPTSGQRRAHASRV